MTLRMLTRAGLIIATACTVLIGAGAVSAKPILMKTLLGEMNYQRSVDARHVALGHGAAVLPGGVPKVSLPGAPAVPSSVQPPAPPCPENGMLPAPFSSCGLPELPATTLPFAGNMAYWGGHVQTRPKVFLVLWGWGAPGAFPGQTCRPETVTEGTVKATIPCDPDRAGKRMADFIAQLGGTKWAGVQTQYYQTSRTGAKSYITNPKNQLGGIWVDEANSITGLPKTSATAPAGPANTYTDLAAEAARAVSHFGVRDLQNADIVVAQPPKYSDPNALAAGYCAFHDYTLPGVSGGIYNAVKPRISYTNMPYALAINSGGANVCGENAVTPGAAGRLDGFSIVLGHEIEETVTDPGAEDIVGSGTQKQTRYGGWYDALDANENGDKCAWVGEPLVPTGLPQQPAVVPLPGALGTMKGNRGSSFAVQSLWSNRSAAGAGYCAGSGTDLPTG